LLGSSLREEHEVYEKIILNNTVIYLCLDRDAIKKSIGIFRKLLKFGNEIYWVNTDPYKDIGDMPLGVFEKYKKDSLKIDNELVLMKYFLGGKL
jgi:hypothetical protein